MILSGPLLADVRYVVKGVGDNLKTNVLAHVDTVQIGREIRMRPRDLEHVTENAVANARAALRPFGYYAPEITARLIKDDPAAPTVQLTIEVGPPIRISNLDVRVIGQGTEDREIRGWKRAWPLRIGAVLNQTVWENQKQRLREIADSRGYLGAEFKERALRINLEENTATITLVFDTGPRYVMGDVVYGEHVLKPGIVEYIPRFEKGDPYTARLVSRLRTDLWITGYFDDVLVREIERPELNPPAVDFDVQVSTESRNEYQGAVGWGDITGARLQAGWTRNPMSTYGDRIDVGIGYRQLDDELRGRVRYRKPRLNRAREWWDVQLTARTEKQDLEVKRDDEDENFIKLANGNVDEAHLRFGRLKVQNLKKGEAQQFTTPFVQYLDSKQQYDLIDLVQDPQVPFQDPDLEARLNSSDDILSVGLEYEVVDVHGRQFDTTGRRDKVWIFYSDEAFGSDIEFTQLYLSTRRSYVRGDRLKLHVRAEVGYSDAVVDLFEIDTPDGQLDLSMTRLPNFYRFKAGGSMSVRGYGFEQLSNNDIGSNNIFTASVEAEYRFRDSWAASVFADIGNAFNDWDDPDLKRGIGVGLRWYSIAGEIRIDVAQAIDYEDKPWRWHFTIGTPLL